MSSVRGTSPAPAARAPRISIDVVSDERDLARLRSDWHDLAATVGAQPFGYPALATSWFRHLGRGRLNVVTARDRGGTLLAVAPMHVRALGPLRFVRFLGTGLGAVGEIVQRPGTADAARAIWHHLAAMPGAVLHLVEARHPSESVRELLRDDDLGARAELRDECPVIELDGWDDATAYLAQPQRSGLRKTIAKARRRLGDQQFETTVASTTAEVTTALTEIGELSDAAEAARPRLNMLRGRYRAVLVEGLVELAEHDIAHVLIGRLDGRPAAFDVYLHSGETAHAILGRAHPELLHHSPGHLLTGDALDWAIGRGAHHVDLQLGADEYKLRWASTTYDTLTVTAGPAPRVAAARAALAAIAAVRGH